MFQYSNQKVPQDFDVLTFLNDLLEYLAFSETVQGSRQDTIQSCSQPQSVPEDVPAAETVHAPRPQSS